MSKSATGNNLMPCALCHPAVSLTYATWLSPIWTKANFGFAAELGWPNVREVAIPPLTPQTSPVPSDALHQNIPRRSVSSSVG